jgi:hypothetical protein
MSDLPPEVTTVDLYIGDRFYSRMSRDLYEEELEIARVAGLQLRALFTAALAWSEGVDLRGAHPLAGTPPVATHVPADPPCAGHPAVSADCNTALTDCPA